MAYFLEAIEGPTKGTIFKVIPGYKVGRNSGDIVLSDPKVSSNHAVIEVDHQGRLFLVDMDSSNGLKINGVRQKKIALMDGVTILIGKTLLRVTEKPSETTATQENAATDSIEGLGQPNAAESASQIPKTWRDQIIEMSSELGIKNFSGAKKSSAFNPALKLTFLGGVQMDSTILLGYGPRRAGSDVLDIELLEEAAPAVAFEISPTPNGNYFSTRHPNFVFLNNQSIESGLIKPGDTIRIGNTIIRIDLWESQSSQEQ